MIEEAEARRLLIDSCHSNAEAEARIRSGLQHSEFADLLVRIAVDADDYGGDAPMQAAYFLSQLQPALPQRYEPALLQLLETADGYSGSVALILGRMQSESAKATIVARLKDGWWPEHLYQQALSYYGQA